MKQEITSRQFAIMIAMSILTFKLTYLPSFLFDFAGKDGFWAFLISLFVDLLTFFIIIPIFLKHKEESFSQFLEKRIGKFASKIVYILIFLFFLMKLIYVSNIGYFFAREAIFQEAQYILFLSILFITINALFLFKINSYARTSEFFYLFLIAFLFACIFLGILTVPNRGFFPLFEYSASDIFTASWKSIFCFGDYLFILPFMGKVQIEKKFKRQLVFYMSISFILLIVFMLTFFIAFRYTGFLHLPAITDIVEFVPLSSIIENLDLLPITLMLSLYVFHGGLFMFCMVNALKDIFKFKHKRYDTRWLLLIVNLLVIPLLLFVFNSYDSLIYIAQTYFVWITAFCMFLIPIFCFVISFKRVKEAQSKPTWAVKVSDENLKWISQASKFKEQIALTKKYSFGGQKIWKNSLNLCLIDQF